MAQEAQHAVDQELLLYLKNYFPDIPQEVILKHMQQNACNRQRCVDSLLWESPQFQGNLYRPSHAFGGSVPDMYAAASTQPPNNLHIAAVTGSLNTLYIRDPSERHRNSSGESSSSAQADIRDRSGQLAESSSHHTYMHSTSSPARTQGAGIGSRLPGEDYEGSLPQTAPVHPSSFTPFTTINSEYIQEIPCYTGRTIGNGAPSPSCQSQRGHRGSYDGQYVQPGQISAFYAGGIGSTGRSPPQFKPSYTPPPPQASGYHFPRLAWGGGLQGDANSHASRPGGYEQQPPSHHYTAQGAASPPGYQHPGPGSHQPASYTSQAYIRMSGGELTTPPPVNPPGVYYPSSGGASNPSPQIHYTHQPSHLYRTQKSTDSGGSMSSGGTPTHQYPPHVPYNHPITTQQPPFSVTYQRHHSSHNAKPTPPQNLLPSTDLEFPRMPQDGLKTPGSDKASTPSGHSVGGGCTPDSEAGPAGLVGEDVAYTEALVHYQQDRMKKLVADLDEGNCLVATLRSEVMEMEKNILERRKARNSAISADDVQKMREENRQMQINIQILAHEIDMINNGMAKLGVIEQPEDQNFYSNIPQGQRGSVYSSSGGSSGGADPYRGNDQSHEGQNLAPPQAPSQTLAPSSPDLSSITPKRRTPPPRPPPPSHTHHTSPPSTHPPPPPYHQEYHTPPPPLDVPPNVGAIGGREEEQEGENWGCSACTFLNHPLLNKCECCEMPRISESNR